MKVEGVVVDVASQLTSLLSLLEPPTPSFTLFEIANGVQLVGPPLEGVAALVVLSGRMYLEGSDGNRPIAPGRVVLLPPDRQVAIRSGPGRAAYRVDGRGSLVRRGRFLVADATRGETAALVAAGTRIAGGDALTQVVIGSIVGCPIGRPIFQLLRAELDRRGEGHPALVASLMSAVVVQALRRAITAIPQDRNDGEGIASGAIARSIASMRARPGESHALDTLADAAGMSRSTFVRHFGRVMRVSPNAFLQQVRLEEARALLRATSLPIKVIASRTGFASRSHFSRLFRSVFGTDPTEFRNNPAGGDPASGGSHPSSGAA